MMIVLCPKAGSLAFTPPGDEMSEVVSRCLPHRQLWVSNLSKVATQWREVDSNPRPFGCKAQNLPLHHGVPSKHSKHSMNYYFCWHGSGACYVFSDAVVVYLSETDGYRRPLNI